MATPRKATGIRRQQQAIDTALGHLGQEPRPALGWQLVVTAVLKLPDLRCTPPIDDKFRGARLNPNACPFVAQPLWSLNCNLKESFAVDSLQTVTIAIFRST